MAGKRKGINDVARKTARRRRECRRSISFSWFPWRLSLSKLFKRAIRKIENDARSCCWWLHCIRTTRNPSIRITDEQTAELTLFDGYTSPSIWSARRRSPTSSVSDVLISSIFSYANNAIQYLISLVCSDLNWHFLPTFKRNERHSRSQSHYSPWNKSTNLTEDESNAFVDPSHPSGVDVDCHWTTPTTT